MEFINPVSNGPGRIKIKNRMMITSVLISKKFLIIIWFGIALVWGILLIYAFQLGLFSGMAAQTNTPLGEARVFLPTATPAATASPTATFPALPDSSAANETLPPANSPLPAPPPEGIAIVLTPPAQAVGWTSTLDGKSHFDDDKIHAGFFKGHVFHGAVQFDLSAVPPGSTITYAALELTGLNDKNLDLGGVWQLRLLNPDIDAGWVSLTYDALRQAAVHSTLQPALPRSELAAGKLNQFVLNNEQLRVLEQRLESGRVSFRIDGPSGGPDNLFSWAANSAALAQPTLKIVVNKLNYVIITSTPTPENILTVAARPSGEATPTPLPAHWVTPVVITATPAPANAATATYQVQLVTAEAIVYGTATPLPANIWTATPEPLLIPLLNGVPPSIAPTPIPAPVPDILVGKIAFLSNRAAPGVQNSEPLVYVIEPDSSAIFLLEDQSIYHTALVRDTLAANQQFLAFAQNVTQNNGASQPAIYFYDYTLNIAEQITRFETGTAYQPAWSPVQERIAFASNSSGAEEIWAINRNGGDALQLTHDAAPVVNKHPSWSPDGFQIVYWSNRTGRAQIWVTNADGGNHRLLHQSEFDDWNPVWIKYNDVITRPLPQEKSVPD